MKHKCPKDGCEKQLEQHILACKPHWYSLEAETRREVNAAWRSGDTTRYMTARKNAVSEMNG